ncbi:MAG: NAD(+)/NADH kinase [Anaerolineales bacterium]|nr:NAD(+)/NADH kinase [Anaerolineales bacterium]
MKLTRVGVIANPRAGRGDARTIAAQAIRALEPREIFVGAGEMGADALHDFPGAIHALDWSAHTGKARTIFLAREITRHDLDALIVIGGDGTMADVARALDQPAPPILGIGVGSANVGPLVTIPSSAIQKLRAARFITRPVDGLIAGANGVDLGLGFNDVVLDFTVLATINDQVVNVDAAQKMNGVNIPRTPEPIATAQTRVVKQSPRGETLVARGDEIATMIVGLPDERFYGKAIAGGVILSSFIGDIAGCLVCNHLLVTTQLDADAVHRAEPIVSRYVGLSEPDRIQVTVVRAGVALCADGNPLKILNEQDCVHVRARRGLATSIRIQESS